MKSKRLTKQQIAVIRAALKEVHAELVGWDPHILVLFKDPAQKNQIIARMGQLGWYFVQDPSNETADVSMVEFSSEPISERKVVSPAGPLSAPVAKSWGRVALFAPVLTMLFFCLAPLWLQQKFCGDGTLVAGHLIGGFVLLGALAVGLGLYFSVLGVLGQQNAKNG
jgi:hypothetical protein